MYPAETHALPAAAEATAPGHRAAAGPPTPWAVAFSAHQFISMAVWWLLRVFWCQPLFAARLQEPARRLEIVRGVPFISTGLRVDAADGLKLHARARLTGAAGARISFGPGCSVGFLVRFEAGHAVQLGARVRIADRAVIGEALGPPARGVTVLGDDVWVGSAAVVISGVTVGPRAIIAAGAVVLDDVPADTVVAGNPARPVRQLTRRSVA